MKHIYIKGLTFLILFCSAPALEAHFFVVTPEQIVSSSEGIFLEINETPVELVSLKKTENGYYVAETQKYYTCPICSTQVEDGRFCPICGFPDEVQKK